MREILFRGKRVDGKGWIEGFLVQAPYDGNIHSLILTPSESVDTNSLEYTIAFTENEVSLIHPETLGKFAGVTRLKEKIFTGDLVEVHGTKRIGKYITEIVEDIQGFTIKENKTYFNNDRCFIAITKIIGNIHDNPDLLK